MLLSCNGQVVGQPRKRECLAIVAPNYRECQALQAQNAEKVPKRSPKACRPRVPKKCRKSRKSHEKVPKRDFFVTFSTFSALFWHSGPTSPGRPFWDFFGILGPEGPALPVTGRYNRKECPKNVEKMSLKKSKNCPEGLQAQFLDSFCPFGRCLLRFCDQCSPVTTIAWWAFRARKKIIWRSPPPPSPQTFPRRPSPSRASSSETPPPPPSIFLNTGPPGHLLERLLPFPPPAEQKQK